MRLFLSMTDPLGWVCGTKDPSSTRQRTPERCDSGAVAWLMMVSSRIGGAADGRDVPRHRLLGFLLSVAPVGLGSLLSLHTSG
jgi:hypothetical protein